MTPATMPDPARLARICGLLGSSFEGERATAAAMATRELQRHGLTWAALIERAAASPRIIVQAAPPQPQPAPPGPRDDAVLLREVMARQSLLNPWEKDFADNLLQRWRGAFTGKQRAMLARIHARVMAASTWP